MKKVYYVTCNLTHKKSKTMLDRSSSEIKEFDNLESAKALFQDLVTLHKVYVDKEDYKLSIKIFEPLRLRSSGKLTTIVGRKIDEFSFTGNFFKKDKDTDDIIAEIEG